MASMPLEAASSSTPEATVIKCGLTGFGGRFEEKSRAQFQRGLEAAAEAPADSSDSDEEEVEEEEEDEEMPQPVQGEESCRSALG